MSYPDGPPTDETAPATTVFNVAVLQDADHATEVIRHSYTGPLCVGALPGVSFRAAMDAADRLRDRTAELYVVGFGPSLLGGRSGLGVDVFLATEDTVARILDVIGPDVAAYTTVTGQFHVVE